ncbi:Cytochrome b2-like protein [Hapsidospora chrysogenum ATCC 11550]|uniref:L-lactate dehydrogenase (cytochrome) n=1 Tax=Hapsidospora chrysogenum (strain ATCC 11550 / CBS 779.69 / DSM 880 / IAM 14645 / JCM 23072 / IMI 49137) TaxID=857340 RepID=A0A086TA64_HAPC1|nr:Cytochrome b2-like protein [Hapsidospora chrysogenum ATCC 11550]
MIPSPAKPAGEASTPYPVKPPLNTLISAHDFELVASQTFQPKAWAFVSSAATDLHTKTRNATAYANIGLRPRGLRDVSRVDLSTTMLGHSIRAPMFCGPVAMAALVHEQGEKDIGRACKQAGIAQCVSTSASYSIDDISAAIDAHQLPHDADGRPHHVPRFFQLYVDKQRDNSRRLLQRARDAGASAIFLTIDAPVPGKREADERIQSDETLHSGMSGAAPANDSKGGALGRTMGGYIDASVSWADIPWLRSCIPGLPIVLKGVQTSEDAVAAMEAGVDAIVVSNHGGRSLDTSPPTVMVLLELRRNCPDVFRSMEVFVDGGITRGTDIFKALCLGARAVGLGRGTLYALNYGHEGVARYIEILRDELETTMKMCGVTSLDQLHPGYLNTLDVEHRIPILDQSSLPRHVKSRL